MRILIAVILALMFLPQVAAAQEDEDKGFLTRTIEGALSGAGREVNITGFRGALSSEASFDQMTIADSEGIWLTLDEVTLIWSRAALLRGRLEVTELRAAKLDLPRLPIAEDDGVEVPQAEAQAFQLPELPVSIQIDAMGIDEISLGEPLLGVPARLSLTAAARLNDEGLDLRLDADRIDEQQGTFGLTGGFARETGTLTVELVLDEAPGGLLARLINLPDQPSVALDIKGEGPLTAFAADIDFSTDGVQRVLGRVTSDGAAPGETGDTRLTADISGDIAPLVAPEYVDFFGPDIGLKADATLQADGMIALNAFDLRARVLELSGNAMLNQDRWPVLIDVTGNMASPDGRPIALPGGEGTTITTATLAVEYDAAQGEAFSADVVVSDVNNPNLRIARTTLTTSGTLQGNLNSVGQFLADVSLDASGLELAQAGAAQALGRDLSLSTAINYIEGQPVRLNDLLVRGAGIDVAGWVILASPAGDIPTRFSVDADVEALERFSGLAQRPLGGAAKLQAQGRVFPLDGMFDIALNGDTTDLVVGIEQADALLAGVTRVDLRARRDETGTFVDDLSVDNAEVSLQADADIRTGNSTVNATARLASTEKLVPEFPGATQATVRATEDGRGWTVEADVAAPQGLEVALNGLATGPDAALEFQASLPNVGVFVPEIPGPLSVEGRAERDPAGWKVQTNATGPSGATAVIAGLVADDGPLNLLINGSVPLGLAQPFIKPRSVAGRARFDLKVDGPPALSSVSGEITTDDVTFNAPNLRVALEDVRTAIRLNGGRANLSLVAQVVAGGQLQVDGDVDLASSPSVNLDVRINDVVVIDPRLYRTQVNGAIGVSGPLSPGPRISGEINIGETEVTVPASGITSIGDIPQITHVGSSRAATLTRERAGLEVKPEEQASQNSGAGSPLDIRINAPNRIFVRGRGLDAELGGSLQLTGTTSRIISAGSFDLIRGQLDILAKRFDLVEGSIQFQGGLVPYLRFVTRTSTSAGTASVIVDGPADDPEVSFEADPEAPEDEVLAQILFGTDIRNISALQALELANAVATLAGRGGSGVIGRLRDGFGLDNLDLTTTDDGQTAVRVGKYLSENVYTDFTAAADGSSEISLNLDVTDSLKATVGAASDGDSSLGLFFERDY